MSESRLTAGAIGRTWLRWRRWSPASRDVFQLAAVIVVAGVLLRVWHILGGRSLWLDEAMVAASIAQRDWAGLMLPLDDVQVAPVGWLFMEKGALEFLGGGDLVLRLPQFLAGVAALVLFSVAARRMLATSGFLISVALFALSPLLVRYSAEVKPYGMDVFASVAVLLLSLRYLRQDTLLTRVDFVALTLVGAAAVAISLPAAFVLAGFGSALLLREALARRWWSALPLTVVCTLWLAVFAWLLPLLRQDQHPTLTAMQTFWGDSFAPLIPGSADDLKWYFKAPSRLLEYFFSPESKVAAALAGLIGALSVFRRHALWGLSLVLPFTLALAASGLHLYPFQDRLMLFALPQLIILMGAGADATVAATRAALAGTAVAAAALLYGSVGSLWGEFTYYSAPFGAEHLRPVMEQVAEQKQPEDAIYVNGAGLSAYRYYSARVGLGDVPIIEGRPMMRGALGCLLADMEVIARRPRIWVIFSHPERLMQPPVSEDVMFAYLADAAGRRLHEIGSAGAHAYLYEFDEDAATNLAELRRGLARHGGCADDATRPIGAR